MNLYMQKMSLGDSANISFYAALEAYYNMGFNVFNVEPGELQTTNIEEENIFLGSIQYIRAALNKLNYAVPEPLDYPLVLRGFLGREVWEARIDDIAADSNQWNVFVKPKGVFKKFTGRVIKSTADLVGCGDAGENAPVWVSEVVQFVAEWRVFIRYGQVLGVKQYKGNWRAQFHYKVIENAIAAYTDAPAGYALDFGLTRDGEMLLVEASDGFALGSYGLFYIDYAKLLATRWAQVTGQSDLCYF